MALMKSKNVPKDAVIMDETEATTYAWNTVKHWKSLSETWALRYGPVMLGGINAASGIYFNQFYRRKLKLGIYGYLSSVIPISAMPGLLTCLFHRHMVSTDLLLFKYDTCPICFELRAVSLQLALGIAYPMVLAPASGLMFANRYNTYRVPSLYEGPKKILGFIRKISKNLGGPLTFICVTQVAASSVLTYFEMRNVIAIRKKIAEIESQIDMESSFH